MGLELTNHGPNVSMSTNVNGGDTSQRSGGRTYIFCDEVLVTFRTKHIDVVWLKFVFFRQWALSYVSALMFHLVVTMADQERYDMSFGFVSTDMGCTWLSLPPTLIMP